VNDRISPWYFNVAGAVEEQDMRPAFSTNDLELEVQLVLAGQVIGQLTNLSAATHIRAGRLVPVLLPYISADYGVFLYYGSRKAQPKRVREFIALAATRLQDAPDFVLSNKEIEAAAKTPARKRRRR
jgi:DNA-binding transcriptional LysR family regulator